MIRGLLVAALLAGCGGSATTARGGDDSTESQCERLVRRAAEVSVMEDTVEDLDDAIVLCESLADLEAASELYPDAFDGAPVAEFVRTRCAYVPDLQPGPVCQDAGQ